MSEPRLKISLCEFNNGSFDLYIIDADTGEEVTITGERKFTERERALLDRLMPTCVFTTYRRERG